MVLMTIEPMEKNKKQKKNEKNNNNNRVLCFVYRRPVLNFWQNVIQLS